MTQEELLNLPNLAVAEVKRFVHIATEEGYVICNYTEDMDILDYYSSNSLYLPIKDEYEELSTITDAQDAIYREEQEEERKRREEEEQADITPEEISEIINEE